MRKSLFLGNLGAMYPVRGLFRMATERGYRTDNPALGVKLPQLDAAALRQDLDAIINPYMYS